MTTVRIPPGFARGESQAAIPGRYTRGNLVRWVNGALKPVGGWNVLTKTPFPTTPRHSFTWLDEKFVRHSGFICDNNVITLENSVFTDITPPSWVSTVEAYYGYGSGRYGTLKYGDDTVSRDTSIPTTPDPTNLRLVAQQPLAFSADKWGAGEFLFGTNADGRVWVRKPATDAVPAIPANGTQPYVPPVAAQPASTIVCPNAPTKVQAFLVTDERSLMCFGGAGVANRVSWSDQGNREGWNFTNVTGQAGYFDLQDAGSIYTARKIPGAILIFTQTAVWVCRYIGYPSFYGFTKLAESVAPISPQAVVVASNKCYWWGQGQFYKYEGGIVSGMTCDLGLDPFEDLEAYFGPRRIVGGFNGTYNEIWWFYPQKGQNTPGRPENNRYVVYNFQEGWWTDGYLARSFYNSSPIDNFPLAGTPDGQVVAHEQEYNAGSTPILDQRWVEVETMSFEDGDRLYTVTQMQTDSGGSPENVRFEFDCRIARGGASLPTERYVPRPDGYVDTRFTARDFTMRIYGMVDAPWAVGALNFDSKPRGKK